MQSMQPMQPMQNQPNRAGPPVSGTITGGGFTGEVTIVPDARANNLLVRANRSDYGLIENVVRSSARGYKP